MLSLLNLLDNIKEPNSSPRLFFIISFAFSSSSFVTLLTVKSLKTAFKNKQDIHSLTASQVFGLPLDKVTEDTEKEIEEEELELIESKSIKGVIFESSKNITKFSKRISKLYKNLLTGISSKNILLLKDSELIVNKLDKDVDLIANNVFYFIKNFF